MLATFTVNSSLDNGAAGTLRYEIGQANSTPGASVIDFDISGSGPFVIAPATPLPVISVTLQIDGTSQPGYTGTPVIQIAGSSADGNGLVLGAGSGGSVIEGLDITGFSLGEGIEASSSGNLIEGNFIGTDLTGKIAQPNGTGVQLDSGASDNTIGGTTASARNVISGNSGVGLSIQGSGSSGNVVEGDYIGVDVTGNAALGNNFGIQISAESNTIGGTASGAGNIIAGNDGTNAPYHGGSQIALAGNPGFMADDNVIEGNYLGLDANGQALAGATGPGILFDVLTTGDVTGNIIGGTSASARNVISGNIDGLLMPGDTGNLVEGNYIGTDPNGTIAIGNGTGDADVLLQGATYDTIGGTTAGATNIISGAMYGVEINQSAKEDLVEGNDIGTDKTGTHALANSSGVYLNDALGGNTIGGATSSPGTGAGKPDRGETALPGSVSGMTTETSSRAMRSGSSTWRAEGRPSETTRASRWAMCPGSRSAAPPRSMRTSSRETRPPGSRSISRPTTSSRAT